MRSHLLAVALPSLVALLVACQAGAAGWRGADVHLVDGTWIGTETACGSSDDQLECRVVLEAGLRALQPDVRSRVTRAVMPLLPTSYVTATGEARTARLTAGIQTRKAIAVDLVDGTRRVIGLWCYLPHASGGGLRTSDVDCAVSPLDYWLDGNAPPSFPPATTFGQRVGTVRVTFPDTEGLQVAWPGHQRDHPAMGRANRLTAQIVFRNMLRSEITPRLRALGFQGSGPSYVLPDDERWLIVAFQKDYYGRAD